jgi:hypothetical protein
VSDLDKLFPGREVTVGGQTIALRPFYFGELPKAVRLLRPVTEAVRGAGIASFDGQTFGLAADWPLLLPKLMDEGGEALLDFVAFASHQPREWFDTLAADEGIALTKAVFEVNGDFFVQKIAPLMGMAVAPQAPATGEPSSPDSSLPATTGAT